MDAEAMTRSDRRAVRRKRAVRLTVIICAAAVLAVLAAGTALYFRHQGRLRQYPLRYKQQIIQAADAFSLEPWHVAAVVRCESSFDAKATSSAGAMGLMQIMPETGQWLAGKFGEADGFDPQTLYDPETNLKYGCWYLNWLMDRYGRNLVLVTAAYHAGQGTVDKWLNDEGVSTNGVTIEPDAIPYSSTSTYVRRILTAYEQYEELYDYDS